MGEDEKINVLRLLKKLMFLVFRTNKKFLGIALLQCLILMFQALYHAAILPGIIALLENGNIKKAFCYGIGLMLLNFSLNIGGCLITKAANMEQIKTKEAINHKIFLKLTKIPYRYLENPRYLKKIEDARFAIENENCITSILKSCIDVVQHMMIVLSFLTFMATFDPIVILVILSFTMINIWLTLKNFENRKQFVRDNLQINRKFVYYNNTLLDYKNGKDFRMYPIGGLLRRKFICFAKAMMVTYRNFLEKTNRVEVLLQILKCLEMISVYGIIIKKILTEKMKISDITFYVSVSLGFSDAIMNLFQAWTKLYGGIWIGRFIPWIMDISEENSGKNLQIENRSDLTDLEFKNVSFTYPNSKDKVLKDVSFKIYSGEKISIVGLNGAGKTTLVKLLCRFYKPDSGDILLNGSSIYEYDLEVYMKKISTIFQDYKLFVGSIRDNIQVNKSEGISPELCLEQVGLKEKVNMLPNGIESIYGKNYEYDGIELSSGEEQRIALARALNKNGDLVILDEPASALDPIAEADFYDKFDELFRNKTVIYISHKLSSSIFCDKILVLDQGRVVAFDTHENLLKKKQNVYYRLFQEQSRRFRMEK